MIKKTIGTIGARYLIAFLGLLLIPINSKALGLQGIGLVGVIYASANIAVIFNSVLCGNTIVYFMNRYHVAYVFWPAYAWAFIGSAIACFCMQLCGALPTGYGLATYALAVLLSLVTVNSRILLGKGRIKAFNGVFMLQGAGLFISLLFIYYVLEIKEVRGYLQGLFITHGVAWLVSFLLLVKQRTIRMSDTIAPPSLRRLLREMFIYGTWSSLDNLAEGLTTRLNYFLVQRMGGLGEVGLLDAGTKISESVWHISRSVSFISYSEVTKRQEAEEQRRLTLYFFKLTYLFMLPVMGAIVLIPEWIYTDYLFTPEFQGVRRVILGLSPGIIAFGANSILSHYFIGTGRVRISTACSTIGLLTLLLSGLFLIPRYGVFGSALSCSIAFCGMLLFSVVLFLRKTHTTPRALLPTAEDLRRIKQLIFRVIKREKNGTDKIA